jgi:hypothetical protein
MKDIVRIMDKHRIKRYIHIGGAAHEGGKNEIIRIIQFYIKISIK